jgi:hypothetical protein
VAAVRLWRPWRRGVVALERAARRALRIRHETPSGPGGPAPMAPVAPVPGSSPDRDFEQRSSFPVVLRDLPLKRRPVPPIRSASPHQIRRVEAPKPTRPH